MDPSRRVWKWTGAVLAVACAALIILHVLLTSLELDGPALDANPAATLESPGRDSARLAPTDHPESASAPRVPEAPGNGTTPDSRFEFSKPQGRIEPDHRQAPRLGGKSEFLASGSRPQASSVAAIDNRQSPIVNSLRPLGIVERADGRMQAVIQDGEWTRLVEEGEVLADNSRVLKVTAQGVEILLPQGEPGVVMAEAREATPRKVSAEMPHAIEDLPPVETESEWAWSGERARMPGRPATPLGASSDLPGLETGVGSYAAPPSRRPTLNMLPATTAPLSPPTAENAQSLEEASAAEQGILGTVAYPDGRVESVVADGPWVKLVAVARRQADSANPSEGQSLSHPAIPPLSTEAISSSATFARDGAVKAPPPGSEHLVSLPPIQGEIQNPESPHKNRVEPIGIVEWTDGRVRAVVAHGDSISFVEGPEAVAHTRRLLALMTPPTGSTDDPVLDLTEPPPRLREEDAAWLVLAAGGDDPRAPPDEVAMPPPEPAEIARGEQEGEAFADSPRPPPPAFDSGENGLWIEDLPGIDAASAAKIEPSQPVERHTTGNLSESEGARAGSVSENDVEGTGASPETLAVQRDRSKAASESPQFAAQIEDRGLTPLGFVRWPDGRARAVILFAGSVILVREGETLADGSVVEKVRPDGVVITTPEAAGASRAGTSAGHWEPPGAHHTLKQPSGSGLQSGPPLRDNRERSRR